MFIKTTAIKKLRKLKKRVRVIPGGTSAGKTFGILPILIDVAIKNPLLEISVVSESVPHLRKGALKDFLKILKDTHRYIDKNYNRTLLTYTFAKGSYIEFFSADQEDKVRGPRRNILYINECNNVSFETYHQLAIRTDMVIWLDFNPTNEFWVHTELIGEPDVDVLVLTYKDNEGLSESIVTEIEKSKKKAYINPNLKVPALFNEKNIKNYYWHNWWRVYGLGMLGKLEGVIFNNWTIVDKVPYTAKLLGYGMDFGFTNDPTTIVAAYRWNGKIIWDELIYLTGLQNGDIANLMKKHKIRRNSLVVADSAEPKSIAEINRYGFNVKPAIKGKDSINFGIDTLQENDFCVTKRSTNLITELRKYRWDVDKTGKILNVPIGLWNHVIDSMRYLASFILPKSRQKRKLRRRN